MPKTTGRGASGTQKASESSEAWKFADSDVAAASESRPGRHQPWRALKRRLVLLIT
jgi:hypothetical protein